MFNRTYQIRSRRGDLVSAGEVIQELVERVSERQSFYRPGKRTSPGNPSISRDSRKGVFPKSNGGKLQGVQLELFHVEQNTYHFSPSNESPNQEANRDRPLFDLFPEAYAQEEKSLLPTAPTVVRSGV